jgi:hypothetical protein
MNVMTTGDADSGNLTDFSHKKRKVLEGEKWGG